MKHCRMCDQTKCLEEFPWRNRANNKRGSNCNECMKVRSRDYYLSDPHRYKEKAKIRKALLRDAIVAAKDRPCIDCGIQYPSCVMDFDHLSDKAFCVAQAPGRGVSLERLVREIAKCDLVCANCHRIRTFKRDVA